MESPHNEDFDDDGVGAETPTFCERYVCFLPPPFQGRGPEYWPEELKSMRLFAVTYQA